MSYTNNEYFELFDAVGISHISYSILSFYKLINSKFILLRMGVCFTFSLISLSSF